MNVNKLYKNYKVSQKKINHMKQVAKLSLIIADMGDLKVDKELLKYSALLHDLGSGFLKNKTGLSDFDLVWGHQVKTKEILTKEGFPLIADVASRHNYDGLTITESREWGYKKGINLLPNSNESKILSFADVVSFFLRRNKEYTHKIIDKKYKALLKKYKMLKKAEQRSKRIYDFLVKHGLDYEKVLRIASGEI